MGQPGLPGSQFPGEDAIPRKLKDLERQVQQFSAANILASAGIGATTGGVLVNGFMEFKRSDGTLGVKVDPATGAFTAYDAAGTTAVARFGALIETAPGSYGVEVLVGGTWVQLGAQSTTWDNVAGRPGTTGGATIDGTFITGSVPHALDSDRTDKADGVTPEAYARDVGGLIGNRLAVYMHESGLMGYNTSSQRYKKNIRDFAITPEQIMQLRFVKYDRKATGADDYTPAVSADEPGFIAEEVAAVAPELAVILDGQAESVRYEMFGPALVPIVQQLLRDNAALKQAVRDLGGTI